MTKKYIFYHIPSLILYFLNISTLPNNQSIIYYLIIQLINIKFLILPNHIHLIYFIDELYLN